MSSFSLRNLHTAGVNEHTNQIGKQKQRALALWDTVKSNLTMNQETADGVSAKLQSGRVPPVFHAYCALSSTTQSRDSPGYPSALAALEGNVSWHHRLFSLVFPILRGVLRSTVDGIPVFFDENGDARYWVVDGGMQEEWKFDTVTTTNVCKLVNADAEMTGEDMEVTSIGLDLGVGYALDGTADYLITRRVSRGVVAEALKLPPRATKSIVGSPGIGISWTLIYALQQALMYDGSRVLFLPSKDRWALMYIRHKDKIYVWRTRLNGVSDLFDDSNCLVLLDPIEARIGGTRIHAGNRRLIYAASNNAVHFDPDIEKKDGKSKMYLSPPSTEEVCVALPYMIGDREAFDRATVLDRIRVVGPLPRWLLSKDMFESRKMKFDSFAKDMSLEAIKDLLESDGLVNNKVALPGTVYAVSPERMIGEGGEFVEVGYDGSGLIYTNRKLSYLSSYVSQDSRSQP
jgi:hypothetical protein